MAPGRLTRSLTSACALMFLAVSASAQARGRGTSNGALLGVHTNDGIALKPAAPL